MNADAVDEAWSHGDPAGLYAAGVRLVSRYLSHDPSKDLSSVEAQQLHAAGLGILLNWESDSGRAQLGLAAGAQDGRDAAALAEQLGAPHGLTIYFSVDVDTDPSMYPAIDAYFRGVHTLLDGRYLVGVYGEADLIEHLHAAGLVTAQWQTYAWSQGRLSALADLYQFLNGQTMAGGSVDLDQIEHPAQLGAWWPTGSPYATSTQEEFMAALSEQQQQQLLAFVTDIHEGLDGQRQQEAFVRDLHNALPTIRAISAAAAATNAAVTATGAQPGLLVRTAQAQAAIASLAGTVTAAVTAAVKASVPTAAAGGGTPVDVEALAGQVVAGLGAALMKGASA